MIIIFFLKIKVSKNYLALLFGNYTMNFLAIYLFNAYYFIL